MSKQSIHSDNAPAAIGTYSQAIQSGDLVFLSGQIPLDPATMEVVDGDFETGGIDAELAIAGLFVSKGKNLERFECDFRWEQSGGTALNNLVALQRSGVKPSTGADIGGDNCIIDEGASQKGIRLRIANVGRCPIATICAAVSDGVQTIGIREYARGPTLDEIRTHFHENGDSIPSGATIMIGKRKYDLCTGELK